jgi:hypothetical protein
MSAGQEPPAPRPRGKPSECGRFAWQSSLALERIVNELGATQAAFGVAVYVALCRLSSREKNTSRIQVEIAKLAGMARLSYRKTADTLKALADKAKVISIESGQRAEGKEQQANFFILIDFRTHNKPSIRPHNKPSSDGIRGTASRAENPKDSLKGESKKETGGAIAPAPLEAGRAQAPVSETNAAPSKPSFLGGGGYDE